MAGMALGQPTRTWAYMNDTRISAAFQRLRRPEEKGGCGRPQPPRHGRRTARPSKGEGGRKDGRRDGGLSVRSCLCFSLSLAFRRRPRGIHLNGHACARVRSVRASSCPLGGGRAALCFLLSTLEKEGGEAPCSRHLPLFRTTLHNTPSMQPPRERSGGRLRTHTHTHTHIRRRVRVHRRSRACSRHPTAHKRGGEGGGGRTGMDGRPRFLPPPPPPRVRKGRRTAARTPSACALDTGWREGGAGPARGDGAGPVGRGSVPPGWGPCTRSPLLGRPPACTLCICQPLRRWAARKAASALRVGVSGGPCSSCSPEEEESAVVCCLRAACAGDPRSCGLSPSFAAVSVLHWLLLPSRCPPCSGRCSVLWHAHTRGGRPGKGRERQGGRRPG